MEYDILNETKDFAVLVLTNHDYINICDVQELYDRGYKYIESLQYSTPLQVLTEKIIKEKNDA